MKSQGIGQLPFVLHIYEMSVCIKKVVHLIMLLDLFIIYFVV